MLTKLAQAPIAKVGKDRTITFIASHERVDADGEVVDVDGIDMTRFAQNPVLLDQHQAQKVAVGRVTRWWKTMLDGAKALMCEAVFPDRPQSDEAYANVKSGLLGGVSIGFRPLETGPRRLPGQKGITHIKTELTEISLVSIPSCATCLIVGKSACACQVPPPSPSIAEEEASAVLIVEDDPVSPAARRAGREAGRLARKELQRQFDAPTFEIEDEFEIDEQALAVGIASTCAGLLTATVATEVRRHINYHRGRVE